MNITAFKLKTTEKLHQRGYLQPGTVNPDEAWVIICYHLCDAK